MEQLIIALAALFLAVFNLLIHLNVIIVRKAEKDKYKEFRDPVTGLLRGKQK